MTTINGIPPYEIIVMGFANFYVNGTIGGIHSSIEICNQVQHHARRSIQKITVQGPNIYTETVYIEPAYRLECEKQ